MLWFYTNLKNRLTCISKTKKVRWHRSVEDLKTSARNVEYSRGVMDKPSGILKIIDDRLDNCEATIELLTLYIVTRLKGIIPYNNVMHCLGGAGGLSSFIFYLPLDSLKDKNMNE